MADKDSVNRRVRNFTEIILFSVFVLLLVANELVRPYLSEPLPLCFATGVGFFMSWRFHWRLILMAFVAVFAVKLSFGETALMSLGFGTGVLLGFGAFRVVHRYFRWHETHVGFIAGHVRWVGLFCACLMAGIFMAASVLFFSWLGAEQAVPFDFMNLVLRFSIGGLVMGPLCRMLCHPKNRERYRQNHVVWLVPLLLNFMLVWISYQSGFGAKLYFAPFFLALFVAYFFGREAVFFSSSVYVILSSLAFCFRLDHDTTWVGSVDRVFESTLRFQLFAIALAWTATAIEEFTKRQVLRWPMKVMISGWTIGSIAVAIFLNLDTQRQMSRIHNLADDARVDIEKKISIYESLLRAGAGFLYASESHNLKNWQQFVSKLDLVNNYPGINGIGLIERIEPRDIGRWLDRMESHGDGKFVFHPVPGGFTDLHHPLFVITAIEPFLKNRPALGLDISSEPRRRAAAEKAYRSKLPTVTEPIQLVQNQIKEPGLLYFLPVFTEANHFLGFVYAPFVTRMIFESSIQAVASQLNLKVSPDSDAFSKNVLYGPVQNQNYVISSPIHFADQTWYLHWSLKPGWKVSSDIGADWFAFVLAFLVLLISLLVSNFALVANRANELAEAKTKELKLSQIKLVQAAKFSALGEMAGGIAHEINNPLAVIRGRAELIEDLMQREPLDLEKLAKVSESIQKTVTRIQKIITGLLSFARDGEKSPMIEASIQQVIDETLEFCASRFKNHDVDLRVQPIEEGLTLTCRPVQISQAILNLLNNAFDAVKGSEGAFVEIAAKQNGDKVEIWITDSGKGIPDAVAEKIMHPFFTTKEVGKGTGLGLSIASGIVKSHGGEFRLDKSCPNTRFVISILSRKQRILDSTELKKNAA